jgi:hypothetical protein
MTARRLPYSELQRLAADFARDNAALRARLALLENPPHFVPLKRAEARGYSTETIQRWATLIDARLDGGKWYVNPTNLSASRGS